MINKVIEDTNELMAIFMKHMNKFDMSSPDYLKTMALSGRLKSASLAYQKVIDKGGEEENVAHLNYKRLLKESEEYIHLNIDKTRRLKKKQQKENAIKRELELKRMREEASKINLNSNTKTLNINSSNKTKNSGDYVPKGTIGKYTLVYGEIYGAEYIGANEEKLEVRRTMEKYRIFVDSVFKQYNYQRILWNGDSFVIFFNDSVIAMKSAIDFKLKMTLFNMNSNSLRKTIKIRVGMDSGEDFQKHSDSLSRKCEESLNKCKLLASSLKFMDNKNLFVKIIFSEECFMSKRITEDIVKNITIEKKKINVTDNGEPKVFVSYSLM